MSARCSAIDELEEVHRLRAAPAAPNPRSQPAYAAQGSEAVPTLSLHHRHWDVILRPSAPSVPRRMLLAFATLVRALRACSTGSTGSRCSRAPIGTMRFSRSRGPSSAPQNNRAAALVPRLELAPVDRQARTPLGVTLVVPLLVVLGFSLRDAAASGASVRTASRRRRMRFLPLTKSEPMRSCGGRTLRGLARYHE